MELVEYLVYFIYGGSLILFIVWIYFKLRYRKYVKELDSKDAYHILINEKKRDTVSISLIIFFYLTIINFLYSFFIVR